MLALFHGEQLGTIFGALFGIPIGVAFFLLYRWETQSLSSTTKAIKVVLILLTSSGLVFCLFMILLGLI
jgi:uncharacterized membrane protein